MDTMLDSVTSWPVVAIETGSVTPKNVAVRSRRNIVVIDSIIHVEKKAMARAGTKNLLFEDLISMFCCRLNLPS